MLYLQYCTCFAINTKMPRLYIQCPTRLYSAIPSTLYILHLHTTVYKLHPQHNMTLYTLYYAILNAPHCTFSSQHVWDIFRTVHIWKSTKAVNYTHYTTCTDCAEHIMYFTVPCCATLCRTKFVMTTALRMLYGTYYSTQSVFTHELFCCTYFILHGVFYVLHSAIRTITYHTYCTRHVVHIVQHTHITRSNHTVVPLLLYEVYQRY